MSQPDPSHILQIGMGFFASKTLLSAVELGLFTELGPDALDADAVRGRLGLSERAAADFLDALVALGLLDRQGDGPGARYANTPETATFLDRNSPAYVGGILEMASARLYPAWGRLTTALKTGEPQNEAKQLGGGTFDALYADPARLEQFMNAMAGISAGDFARFAADFDFSRYTTLCDVGAATAQLACRVAAANPHMRCTSFDLPAVAPIAQRRVLRENLADRVTVATGDFFSDPLPTADVITMARILHDWGLPEKKMLIAKAYEALPPGGALVAIEALIDDQRRSNAFGLLMSLNMLVETDGGFDYTAADFESWCREAGFRDFAVLQLPGPSGAAIAYK